MDVLKMDSVDNLELATIKPQSQLMQMALQHSTFMPLRVGRPSPTATPALKHLLLATKLKAFAWDIRDSRNALTTAGAGSCGAVSPKTPFATGSHNGVVECPQDEAQTTQEVINTITETCGAFGCTDPNPEVLTLRLGLALFNEPAVDPADTPRALLCHTDIRPIIEVDMMTQDAWLTDGRLLKYDSHDSAALLPPIMQLAGQETGHSAHCSSSRDAGLDTIPEEDELQEYARQFFDLSVVPQRQALASANDAGRRSAAMEHYGPGVVATGVQPNVEGHSEDNQHNAWRNDGELVDIEDDDSDDELLDLRLQRAQTQYTKEGALQQLEDAGEGSGSRPVNCLTQSTQKVGNGAIQQAVSCVMEVEEVKRLPVESSPLCTSYKVIPAYMFHKMNGFLSNPYAQQYSQGYQHTPCLGMLDIFTSLSTEVTGDGGCGYNSEELCQSSMQDVTGRVEGYPGVCYDTAEKMPFVL